MKDPFPFPFQYEGPLQYDTKLNNGNAIPITNQKKKRKFPRTTEQSDHKAWQRLKNTRYYKNSDKYNGCLKYDDNNVHDIGDDLKKYDQLALLLWLGKGSGKLIWE